MELVLLAFIWWNQSKSGSIYKHVTIFMFLNCKINLINFPLRAMQHFVLVDPIKLGCFLPLWDVTTAIATENGTETGSPHLALDSSLHQRLIGQLGHGRHGGPQVAARRRQDVSDGDAGRLVRYHGGSVQLEMIQKRRGGGLQQLPPAGRHVLFTEQNQNRQRSLEVTEVIRGH